jgi:ectoine hydroxylase-related dioxygenase (phytanoyl-CoA dioxygenase family)
VAAHAAARYRCEVLSRSDIAALDAAGYVVVPGALDAAWVSRLKVAFERAAAQQNGTQHVEITEETPEVDAWLALKEHPSVLAAAEHVLSRPFRVRDLHGRNPLPGFGQQGLHSDWMERPDPRRFFVLTALWMIDDFTVENGATRLVPGSHRLVRTLPKALVQPAARHPEERVVTGSAGSVLLLNGHTWHSGRRNESGGPRRAGQMVLVRGAAADPG